ncbi:MAG: hypothetical protein RBS40_13380 [Rhodocyclaceae bacterium]|jgi:hypothetical protein|nr:hypothetical protein [Rhodocyclaceae bacterium]
MKDAHESAIDAPFEQIGTTGPAGPDQQLLEPSDPVERGLLRFVASGHGYGDVVPTEWFREVFHIDPPRRPEDVDRNRMYFADCLGKLRKRLLIERKLLLRTVAGVGQEVVRPAEQTDYAMQMAQEAIRREIDRASNRVRHVNISMLSASEQAENRDAQAKLSFFNARKMDKLSLLPANAPLCPPCEENNE